MENNQPVLKLFKQSTPGTANEYIISSKYCSQANYIAAGHKPVTPPDSNNMMHLELFVRENPDNNPTQSRAKVAHMVSVGYLDDGVKVEVSIINQDTQIVLNNGNDSIVISSDADEFSRPVEPLA